MNKFLAKFSDYNSKQDKQYSFWIHSRKKHKKRKVRSIKKVDTKIKYMPYDEFLKSDYWKKVKHSILKRDNYKCTRCGSTDKLHVHHLMYNHHFNELNHLKDLTTLCSNCHNNIHKLDNPNFDARV